MPRSAPMPALLLRLMLAGVAAMALVVGEARPEVANPWRITTERDQLTGEVARLAVTTPKADSVAEGKSAATALIIQCGRAFQTGPTHPEVLILLASFAGTRHVRSVHARYRFDDGPVRDYTLDVSSKGDARAIMLPKFSDQDPAADLVAAKRLRVEIAVPRAGASLLDFDVAGGGDAVRAISCQ